MKSNKIFLGSYLSKNYSHLLTRLLLFPQLQHCLTNFKTLSLTHTESYHKSTLNIQSNFNFLTLRKTNLKNDLTNINIKKREK